MNVGAKYYELSNSFLPFQTYRIFEVKEEKPKHYVMDNGLKVLKSKGFSYYGLHELTEESKSKIAANNVLNNKYKAVKKLAEKIRCNGFTAKEIVQMYEKVKEFIG